MTAPLPTLLFGARGAERQTDHRVLGDRMNQIYPGVNAYDPIGCPSEFSSRMNFVQLTAMRVVAVAMSPSYVDRSSTTNATLKIPLTGEFDSFLDGRTHQCGAGAGGMYFPQGSGQVKGHGGTCSQVSLQFEPRVLQATARAMLGVPVNAALALNLESPRVVPLAVAGKPLSAVLQHVGSLIDLYERDAEALTQLGIQDLLYRHIAMMLLPDAASPSADMPRTTASAALIAQLCDYMRANLESGLTLTDLEKFSGLSARGLQMAFKKHAGCSPMQWLTAQKLHAIRSKLLHADASESVTSLAGPYFPNLGDFARYYRHQFGELPSQTLSGKHH